MHDPPVLAPDEQAGPLENRQVLHEAGQRHRGALRENPHGRGTPGELLDDRAAGRVGKRREHPVEVGRRRNQTCGRRLIVNHKV